MSERMPTVSGEDETKTRFVKKPDEQAGGVVETWSGPPAHPGGSTMPTATESRYAALLGALAYVILFIPVVAAGRYLETRFAWRRA